MNNKENDIIIYEDKNGITKVNVKFMNEDLWLTKHHIADIYKTTRQNIEQHINNIYEDKELELNSTCKKFLQVQKEGNREVKRNIDHYNLDMIIALGYRVQSDIAVRFRIWATKRLHEYIQKGYTIDIIEHCSFLFPIIESISRCPISFLNSTYLGLKLIGNMVL